MSTKYALLQWDEQEDIGAKAQIGEGQTDMVMVDERKQVGLI